MFMCEFLYQQLLMRILALIGNEIFKWSWLLASAAQRFPAGHWRINFLEFFHLLLHNESNQFWSCSEEGFSCFLDAKK